MTELRRRRAVGRRAPRGRGRRGRGAARAHHRTRARARGRSRGRARPRGRVAERAVARAARRDRRAQRRERRRRPATTDDAARRASREVCRGEHDHARGHPRDAARRDGARRACRAARRGHRRERRRVPRHRRRARALRTRSACSTRPISESAIVGASVGLSVAGLVPVAEIQFGGFTMQAYHQLVGQLARFRYRSRGRYHCPVTVRSAYGGGVRTPEHHSDSVEAPYTHAPGLERRGAVERGRRQGPAHHRGAQRRPGDRVRTDPLLPHVVRGARRRAPRAARRRRARCARPTTR